MRCFTRVLAALTLSLAFPLSDAAESQTLWYNGDGDPQWFLGGTHNNIEWTLFDKTEMVFEDFVVADPHGWTVTAVWSNNITNSRVPITQARWEIRSLMQAGPTSAGGGGTLIAGGVSQATQRENQIVDLGHPTGVVVESTIEVSGLAIHLPPGTYWVGVAPVITESDQSLPSDTLGFAANAVGTAGGEGNAYVWRRNWSFAGEDNFVLSDRFSSMSGPPNYSLGVAGSVVKDALWYNGDGDPQWFLGGTHNNIEWTLFDKTEMVFEDFVVADPHGWTVTAVWSNNITNSRVPITQARWEIRSLMQAGPTSAGGGGTLIAGGISQATQRENQIVDLGHPTGVVVESTIEVSGLAIHLPPGTYWVGVAPVITESDQSLPSDTLGFAANAVGTAGGEGNAFVWRRNWSFAGEDSFVLSDRFSSLSGPPNYSLGIAGSIANEAATTTGMDVVVNPILVLADGSATSVGVSFDNVQDSGVTTVTASSSLSEGTPGPPGGFKIGEPPVYYDVNTTATFTGTVTLCFSWREGQLHNEGAARLFHYEDGVWRDVTTSLDTAGNRICGQVSTLSPFAIFERSHAFTGFFHPVDNPPTRNLLKAGAAVPIKFNLNGDYGLAIFDRGFPGSQQVQCENASPLNSVEETVSAGASSLIYDPSGGLYTYVWKTEKGWANSCRRLILQLNDGSTHTAIFSFSR